MGLSFGFVMFGVSRLGGSALNGRVIRGQYTLAEHGVATLVSKRAYYAVAAVETLLIVSWPLGFLIAAKGTRVDMHAQQAVQQWDAADEVRDGTSGAALAADLSVRRTSMRRHKAMSRVFAVILLLVSSMAPAIDVPPPCGLTLKVGPPDLDLVTSWTSFTATLTNAGSRPVTLVMPGDGSLEGDRTPIVEWHFVPRTSVTPGFCGNINTLKLGEVFVLNPGESRELGNWALPSVMEGPYRARMTYINEPSTPWRGVPLGEHDRGEMRRLKRSDRCSVGSNEILVRGYRDRARR
jgi:hypothetical protein